MAETLDLRPDGIAAWKMVEESPILLGYNNPWFRFAVVFVVCVLAATVVRLIWGPDAAIVTIGIALVAGAAAVTSLYFLLGEKRIGALLAEVSKDYVAVGCAMDRIVIPWTAVDTQAEHLPVNDKFMAIPVAASALDEVKFETAVGSRTWDRTPYRRFIVAIKYNPRTAWIEIHATPNEFFIHLLTFVYPMIIVHRERNHQHAVEGSSRGK